ncbi:hypothetical protein [Pyxidicoccus sp. MSG2]|uniref:hypothetical protein n=1 Tax=Pyxidicoccus sp. MSG2 TaxID=2996790 RepID=UPI0022710472|nr:hypothetical protein [Pyxidicoccus sp. MSG2]MCY1018025.1 hypothetical protein [Pyxidicoccus sp. MSG2]
MLLLEPTQRDVVFRRIQELTGGHALALIGAWMGNDLRDSLNTVLTNKEQIEELLRFCEKDGLSGPQPLLLKLLDRPELRIYPEVAAILADLRKKKDTLVQTDPYGQCLLMRKPFINRWNFRQVLQDFVARNPTRRLLVVNGRPKSGKSYSKLYVTHLKAACSGFAPVWFSTVGGQPESYTPDEVARGIVAVVDGNVGQMPAQHSSDNRRAHDLATWVINELGRRSMAFCLFLDGLRNAPRETHAFIYFLADALTSNLHHVDGRLVLIDYDKELLADLPYGFDEDNLDSIQKPDVEKFFLRVHPDPSQDNIDKAVAKVFSKLTVTPADEQWQAAVAKAVLEVTREL